jgi:signal peptidase I
MNMEMAITGWKSAGILNRANGNQSTAVTLASGLELPQMTRTRQVLLLALLTLAAYFLFSQFVLQSVTVMGGSMAPTLNNSKRYLLNRWVYHVRAPRQSDIVVLRDPVDHGLSVKRVVATEGDVVELKGKAVFVNGVKLNESYLEPGTPTYTYAKAREISFRCGKDECFVLGDNRTNSTDSRAYGPVPRSNVLGMIVL